MSETAGVVVTSPVALVALLVALLVGVMAPVLWWALCRRRRMLVEAGVTGPARSQRRTVSRMVRRPVPSDPVERAEAARVVAALADRRRRVNRWVVPAFVLIALAQVGLTVLASSQGEGTSWLPWFSAGAAALAAGGCGWEQRILTRRLAALQEPSPHDPPVVPTT